MKNLIDKYRKMDEGQKLIFWLVAGQAVVGILFILIMAIITVLSGDACLLARPFC